MKRHTAGGGRQGETGPRVLGGLIGLLLGIGLLVWALAVEVIHFGGGGEADACTSREPECALFRGLAQVGSNVSSEITGMIVSGIFLATVILVGIGIWLGGVFGRRRRRRKASDGSSPMPTMGRPQQHADEHRP